MGDTTGMGETGTPNCSCRKQGGARGPVHQGLESFCRAPGILEPATHVPAKLPKATTPGMALLAALAML